MQQHYLTGYSGNISQWALVPAAEVISFSELVVKEIK